MKLASIGLIAAVVISVVVGVWLIFFAQEAAAPAVDTSVPAVPVEATDELSGRATLASLLASSDPLECSFTFADIDTMVAGEGTGFFAGGLMRVDALYTGESNEQYTSNLIVDDTTMYVWASTADGEFAFMMPKDMNTMTESEVSGPDQAAGTLSPDEEVRYTCKPWSVDGSVFVPPANIEFVDMNTMMQQMMDGMTLPAGM